MSPRSWNWTSSITGSFAVTDISQRTEQAEMGDMTPPSLVTHRQEGQLVGRPLWLQRSRPVLLAECSESGNRRWRSRLLHRHLRWETAPVCRTAHTHADTVHALGVILWRARVLPATSRLDNNSHFEYPMKYMKLPEYKYKWKSKGLSSVRQTCPASFSVRLMFSWMDWK